MVSSPSKRRVQASRRISRERTKSWNWIGFILRPQAARRAEIGDAAFGGDAGAGEHDRAFALRDEVTKGRDGFGLRGDPDHRRSPVISPRRRLEIISMTATRIRKTIRMNATMSQWLFRAEVGEVVADAAGADDAEHGSGPHVGFEEIKRLAELDRQDLRQEGKAQDLEARAADRGDALDRFSVGILDRLGTEFRERREVRHHQRQHAGHRAETDGGDEHQRPDQRGNAAEDVEDAAHDEVDRPGSRPRSRRRDRRAERR